MHFPVFFWCSCCYFIHLLLFGVFLLQPALYGKLEGLHKHRRSKEQEWISLKSLVLFEQLTFGLRMHDGANLEPWHLPPVLRCAVCFVDRRIGPDFN